MSIDWIKCSCWRCLCLLFLLRILWVFFFFYLSQITLSLLDGLVNSPKSLISFCLLLSDFGLRHTCMPSSPATPQRPLIVPFHHFCLFYFFSFAPSFPSFRSALLDCPTNIKCQPLMVQARSGEQARLSGV